MKWFPLVIALSLGANVAVADEAWQQQEQAREQQAQDEGGQCSAEDEAQGLEEQGIGQQGEDA